MINDSINIIIWEFLVRDDDLTILVGLDAEMFEARLFTSTNFEFFHFDMSIWITDVFVDALFHCFCSLMRHVLFF